MSCDVVPTDYTSYYHVIARVHYGRCSSWSRYHYSSLRCVAIFCRFIPLLFRVIFIFFILYPLYCSHSFFFFFFFNNPAPPEIYPLPLHDALPIFGDGFEARVEPPHGFVAELEQVRIEERQVRVGRRSTRPCRSSIRTGPNRRTAGASSATKP